MNLQTLVNAQIAFQNLLEDHARLASLLHLFEDRRELRDETIDAWSQLAVEIKKEFEADYKKWERNI